MAAKKMPAKKMPPKPKPKPVNAVPEKGKAGRSTSLAKGKPFYASPRDGVLDITTRKTTPMSDAVVAPRKKKK